MLSSTSIENDVSLASRVRLVGEGKVLILDHVIFDLSIKFRIFGASGTPRYISTSFSVHSTNCVTPLGEGIFAEYHHECAPMKSEWLGNTCMED